MEIYLDNSATTRAFPEVAEKVAKVMTEDYGNPSSMHMKGVDAEKYIKEAKSIFAGILKVNEKEIFFTSGGTESDNLAIIGSAFANQRAGKHIITSKIEHPAVLESMKYLESQGFEVTYLGTNNEGVVEPEELKKALRDDTILVSIMHTNNEIGSLQKISDIGVIIKEHNKNTLFHVDAVQGFGKAKILPKKMNIDMLSISSHKIHGPKGVGVLYIAEKTKIHNISFGGGQQGNMRSGTENVPGIAGMALAAKMIYAKLDEECEKLYSLKVRFIEEATKIPDVTVNGPKGKEGAPHIVSLSFAGVRAEVLLHALEDKGIYVSSGSACATNHPEISKTLRAIDLDKSLWDSTIRFSFSVFTTEEEIDETVKALNDIIPTLRKYARR
ncbi:MAG: cysteine desulfurase [Lachnospiraceae bacterium]|nr:cysteine desulfurase [Lachnospiraceae bacterium]